MLQPTEYPKDAAKYGVAAITSKSGANNITYDRILHYRIVYLGTNRPDYAIESKSDANAAKSKAANADKNTTVHRN